MLTLATDPTGLQIVWYLLIAVLWTGFFFLEGFDFGVAMLIKVLGRNDRERRLIINTIGPTWDGNEVWLLTAGGATFAAFPGWYATLFSGLYLPLFLVLVGLILRGVSFEYRSKNPETAWRNMFDWFAIIGSFLPALVLGVGFANFLKGLKVGSDVLISQSFWSLFSPFGLLGGLLFVALFVTHGAVFISLKTKGEMHQRSRAFAVKAGAVSTVLMLVFVLYQNLAWPASENPWFNGGAITWITGLLAVAALAVATWFARQDREGIAFLATGLSIIFLMVNIFTKMYGNLGFISTDPNNPLDIITASSSPMTLKIMTWAAVIFVPIVLGYQSWSYWVFRRRLGVRNMPQDLEHEALTGPQTKAVAGA
ncbi:MAG TPA: cytochrome d ubiquinol oxidase subunit II [Propionibacteriaceae bacterium]|nr:cytochrome d ubiquinol oxidase subunit II [Propionibacteriaceae bacterium]